MSVWRPPSETCICQTEKGLKAPLNTLIITIIIIRLLINLILNIFQCRIEDQKHPVRCFCCIRDSTPRLFNRIYYQVIVRINCISGPFAQPESSADNQPSNTTLWKLYIFFYEEKTVFRAF